MPEQQFLAAVVCHDLQHPSDVAETCFGEGGTLVQPDCVCGMQAGSITVPATGGMFYLSQRPYLVTGSLRDQLLYPQPPRLVWDKTNKATKAKSVSHHGHIMPAMLLLPFALPELELWQSKRQKHGLVRWGDGLQGHVDLIGHHHVCCFRRFTMWTSHAGNPATSSSCEEAWSRDTCVM